MVASTCGLHDSILTCDLSQTSCHASCTQQERTVNPASHEGCSLEFYSQEYLFPFLSNLLCVDPNICSLFHRLPCIRDIPPKCCMNAAFPLLPGRFELLRHDQVTV